MENSVDPDLMKPDDLDLQCLQQRVFVYLDDGGDYILNHPSENLVYKIRQ